jgi:hypothetical protein
MLVITGLPARASESPCNPCPPDCPMMAQMQMAAAAADHHATSPGKSGKAENPCKQGVACQTSAASPILSETPVAILLSADAADVYVLNHQGSPSQPPDETLRPPKQL